MHFCGVLKPLKCIYTLFYIFFSKCICQENVYNVSSTSVSSRKPSTPAVNGYITVCKRGLHCPVQRWSARRMHEPTHTLHCHPGSSIPQTPFPRGLMSITDLLFYLEPKFSLWTQLLQSTRSIFTQQLWVDWAQCPMKGQQGSSGTTQCLARRHCSTIVPVKLGWGVMWETPCRNHTSVGAIQRGLNPYAVEHNTIRLAVIKQKKMCKCQPWWSIDRDISY